jgi:hemerythrin
MTHINPSAVPLWHEDLLLGHPPMDSEHETLARLIVTLNRVADDALPAALDALAAHATQHFESENAAMAETAFPPRDCHIDEHAAVLRSVQEVRELLAQGKHAVARRLGAELEAWFPAHVQHLDSALSHWLCKLRLGGKPVVLRRRPKIAAGSADTAC